jgi:undecaprenyl-phosphate 4-deoxy-4-formamido-L-arabinose transferase
MRLAIYLGLIAGFSSILAAAYTLVNYTIQDKVAPGWTSIVFFTTFFGGLNLIFLGVIGEYIGRIYLESRGVPQFLIHSIHGRIGDS